MFDPPRIFSLGDDCVTVHFGNEISIDTNSQAITLAERLNSDKFPGLIEAVPAYSSVSVYFDIVKVRGSGNETAAEIVRRHILSALRDLNDAQIPGRKIVEIEVDFSNDVGPDLEQLARFSGMSRDDVIELFTSRTYRVYMLGFLPGFAYMGEVDDRIAMPRRETPRTNVKKGSVGIAGKQTGIYPFESPGGWQIIGRTQVEMFSLDRDPNSLLEPGDGVRFVPIA